MVCQSIQLIYYIKTESSDFFLIFPVQYLLMVTTFSVVRLVQSCNFVDKYHALLYCVFKTKTVGILVITRT